MCGVWLCFALMWKVFFAACGTWKQLEIVAIFTSNCCETVVSCTWNARFFILHHHHQSVRNAQDMNIISPPPNCPCPLTPDTCITLEFSLSFKLIAGGCPTPEERASNKEALQVALTSSRTLADVPASLLRFRSCYNSCLQGTWPQYLIPNYWPNSYYFFLNSALCSSAGGQRMTSQRWRTKLVVSWEAVRDVWLYTCF